MGMATKPAPKPGAKAAQFPASRQRWGGGSSSLAPQTLRPQTPVRLAAQDQQVVRTPAGLGLDSALVRQRMVERLRTWGIDDPRVLQAFALVPRHQFVDSALVTQAYEDTSLPIGHGQTISKPLVIARMLSLAAAPRQTVSNAEAVASRPLGKVLEIGTGCGYQAALLSVLGRSVFSIERIRALHDKARLHLNETGITDVRLIWGDGYAGHPPNAPYDTIVSAAGGSELPQAWLAQLALGGVLVAPVESPAHGGQVLMRYEKTATGWQQSLHDGVEFVPLKSGLLGQH